jgi:CARDB protein
MRLFLVLSISLLLLVPTSQAAKTLPFPPPPPPDLTFSAFSILSPSVVHAGSPTIVFSVTETNLGGSATGPYMTYYFSNGVAFCARQRTAGLAAGASATFTDSCVLNNGSAGDCSPGSGTMPFFAFVDSLGQVAESNEGNNISPTVILPTQCP